MKFSESQVLASVCRRSLATFMKEFWHVVSPTKKLDWNWHIQLMCDTTQEAYERVFRGEPKPYDLVTNVPPGSSKSTVKSVMAPAWAWTRMPSMAYCGASYTHGLALQLARKNRDIVKSELYQACFPEVRIREDLDTKSEFMSTAGGQRIAVGSCGDIIGKHFDVICLDDPINPDASLSDADRFRVNTWMTGMLFQRVNDLRVSLYDLVMQRLHQDDPTAVMTDGYKVHWIRIPATDEYIINPPELKKFYVDGLMDPKRFPREVLEQKQNPRALGEYGFAGQYGQDPVPLGGGMFKTDMINVGTPPGKYKRMVRFWDNAACLVAGTLITTSKGEVPIELVRKGDRVLTRKGFRRVRWSGMTKKVESLVTVEFGNGRSISGTADHLCWTQNRGWVRLDSLLESDRMISLGGSIQCHANHELLCPTRKLSPSMVSVIHEDQESDTSKHGENSLMESTELIRFTKLSGVSITETSPKVMTFTTKTRTGITTQSKILSVCLTKLTPADIPIGGIRHIEWPIWNWAESISGRINLTKNVIVKNVGTSLSPEDVHHLNSATLTVELDSEDEKLVPVYDISVCGCHEFFANGVLVHNSKTKRSAFSAGPLLAEDYEGGLWILDLRRGQWDSAERERYKLQTARKDGQGVLIGQEQEPGSGGKDSALSTVRILKGFNVQVLKARGTKEVRADAFSTQVNGGNVWMPSRMKVGNRWIGWAKEVIDELRYWPHSTFMDIGDALGGAYSILAVDQVYVGTVRGSNKHHRPNRLREILTRPTK